MEACKPTQEPAYTRANILVDITFPQGQDVDCHWRRRQTVAPICVGTRMRQRCNSRCSLKSFPSRPRTSSRRVTTPVRMVQDYRLDYGRRRRGAFCRDPLHISSHQEFVATPTAFHDATHAGGMARDNAASSPGIFPSGADLPRPARCCWRWAPPDPENNFRQARLRQGMPSRMLRRTRNFATNRPACFAAGDMRRWQSLVVLAHQRRPRAAREW